MPGSELLNDPPVGDDALKKGEEPSNPDGVNNNGGNAQHYHDPQQNGNGAVHDVHRHQHQHHTSDADLDLLTLAASSEGGFFGQFGACMVKNFHQKRRDKCGCCLETMLPFLFVLGLVGIWGATKRDSYPDEHFIVEPTAYNETLNLYQWVCSTNSSIDGLQPCPVSPGPPTPGPFPGMMVGLFCHEHKKIPVTGFCTLMDVETMVRAFQYSLFQSPMGPIPLDIMILVHWAMQARDRDTNQMRFQSMEMALYNGGQLHFAPAGAEVDALRSHLNATTSLFKYIDGHQFPDEATGERWCTAYENEGETWALVVLDKFTPTEMSITVRANRTALLWTHEVLSETYTGGLGRSPHMLAFASGYITIQHEVLRHYIVNVQGKAAPPDPVFVPMPTKAYTAKAFLALAGGFAPLIVVLSYLYPVSQITKRLVLEKELRVREVMMIMGLGNASFYLSWLMTYTIQVLFSAIFCTMLLRGTFLPQSDGSIIFFLFFFFGVSSVALALIMSSLFSKSRIAALLSPLVYFVLAMPLFATDNVNRGGMIGLSLLSPSAFAIGVQLLVKHEQGGGLTQAMLDYHRDDVSMLVVQTMLVFDAIVYILFALYLDAVMPNEWGTPRHPIFFILEPIAWLRRKMTGTDNVDNLPDGRDVNGVFEEETDENVQIRVKGLRKEFTRGSDTFTAVNDLHLNLKSDQVSVLLGHNGAGKTTTMNLMTGMMEMDQGDCIVYGKSVKNNLHAVRRDIGYCPQHNVLWPELTCAEHLRFFSALKGMTAENRDKAAVESLKAVDLLEKKDVPAGMLSGGQKRKLSVAIAFVGNSRLIFLDEPTAGMDVVARRHTWDLIKSLTKGRTILLTTHFMDEADFLGHNISIMSKGSLKCSGSSMFLKSRLGVGYSITMSVDPHLDATTLSPHVHRFIPDAETLACGAGEAAYRLPVNSLPKFPDLLRMLENEGESMGVSSWSITVTTLEEIFLRIAQSEELHESPMTTIDESLRAKASFRGGSSGGTDFKSRQQEEEEEKEKARQAGLSPSAANLVRIEKVHEEASKLVWDVNLVDGQSALFGLQFKTMMLKRFHNSRRDRRTVCLQIVTPVLCILLAMLLTLLSPPTLPKLPLDPSIYGAVTEAATTNCEGILSDILHPMVINDKRDPVIRNDSFALSEYLLETHKTHEFERFDSFYCADPKFSSSLGFNSSVIFHNASTLHQTMISHATYFRAYAAQQANTYLNPFQVYHYMLPWTARENALINGIRTIFMGIIIMIPFTFIPSTFVSWIVKEKECKARHLQNVSGLRFYVYWLSNLLFDFLSSLVTTFLAIIVFLIFDREEYIAGGQVIGATILLFVFYSLSGIAIAYTFSFLFEEHSTAQNVVMLTNFICGFLLVLVVFILKEIESTEAAGEALQWIFRIVPSYCLGEGIIQLAQLNLVKTFGGTGEALDMKITGYSILYMAIEFPLFFILTLVIDHPSRRMRQQQLFHDPTKEADPVENEDEDVKREREAVEGGESGREKDLVVVKKLHKRYPNGKVAVKNVSFGVHAGEVFGFLGTNGAGKTTTIAVLCQEFLPTHGQAYIVGHDVVKDSEAAPGFLFIFILILYILYLYVLPNSNIYYISPKSGQKYIFLPPQRGRTVAPYRTVGCLPEGSGRCPDAPIARRRGRQGRRFQFCRRASTSSATSAAVSTTSATAGKEHRRSSPTWASADKRF